VRRGRELRLGARRHGRGSRLGRRRRSRSRRHGRRPRPMRQRRQRSRGRGADRAVRPEVQKGSSRPVDRAGRRETVLDLEPGDRRIGPRSVRAIDGARSVPQCGEAPLDVANHVRAAGLAEPGALTDHCRRADGAAQPHRRGFRLLNGPAVPGRVWKQIRRPCRRLCSGARRTRQGGRSDPQGKHGSGRHDQRTGASLGVHSCDQHVSYVPPGFGSRPWFHRRRSALSRSRKRDIARFQGVRLVL
jgi:hypothetical protein